MVTTRSSSRTVKSMSKIATKWLKDNKVRVLVWPSQSPDLNLITFVDWNEKVCQSKKAPKPVWVTPVLLGGMPRCIFGCNIWPQLYAFHRVPVPNWGLPVSRCSYENIKDVFSSCCEINLIESYDNNWNAAPSGEWGDSCWVIPGGHTFRTWITDLTEFTWSCFFILLFFYPFFFFLKLDPNQSYCWTCCKTRCLSTQPANRQTSYSSL